MSKLYKERVFQYIGYCAADIVGCDFRTHCGLERHARRCDRIGGTKAREVHTSVHRAADCYHRYTAALCPAQNPANSLAHHRASI